jgi:5'-phosphate synthase pdxT subunit
MINKVGVLALQGDFAEHAKRFEELGCETVELRSAADIDETLDALVLPGGESTVQVALLEEFGMLEPIRALIEQGLPTFATCAGLVLLASEVEHSNGQQGAAAQEVVAGALATLPVRVKRNAYGRQLASFHAEAPLKIGAGSETEEPVIPMTFIRAPQIQEVYEGAEVLAEVDGAVVAVRYKNQLAATFHPELDSSKTLYNYFLSTFK